MSEQITGLLTPYDVSTETVTAKKLDLNGVAATAIIQQVEDISPENGLLTLRAIKPYLQNFEYVYELVNGDNSFLEDLTLMSTSIVDVYLEDPSDWVLKNWSLTDNRLNGAGGYSDNYAMVAHTKFKQSGAYFLTFNVEVLPSGHIDLYLNDTWLGRVDQAGTYLKEVEIADINDELKFILVNTIANEAVVINEVALYYLSDRFFTYLTHKVKSLATIDAEQYLKKEEFNHLSDELIAQFNLVTNKYLENLKNHAEAVNPHDITPELIGAAQEIHEHEQYLEQEDMTDYVSEQLREYSRIDHNHDTQYVKLSDIDATIGTAIDARINEIITVAPMIITDAPDGKLPSRFEQTDVTSPLQILLPTTMAYGSTSTYDYTYGLVTSNDEKIMGYASGVFQQLTELPADLDYTNKYSFGISYHCKHRVTGYRIHCKGKQLTEWSVYVNLKNSTFLHRITNPNNYVTEDDHQMCEIILDTAQYAKALYFVIEKVQDTVDPLSLWIEILYNDYDNTHFGITEEKFSFCVPSSATNRVITHEEELSTTAITPDVIVPNVPCYIFARKDLEDSNITIIPTYIPPEYDTICKGIDILEHKFENIERVPAEPIETYIHPAYGTLTLVKGTSAEDKQLKQVYAGNTTSWYSNGVDDTITITQTFKSNHVVIRSYLLNWRQEDEGSIPDTWTLTVEGTNTDGNLVNMVVDSVDQYYPFYSVEDDDIVYHATINCDLLVSKVTLTMKSNTPGRQLAINKVGWYMNEMYYSIPQNTMYYGREPASATCLGWVTYNEKTGFVPTNLCLGKSVNIPVNNLEKTERFTTYTVPNPFFTTAVTVNVRNYVLQDSDIDGGYPSAYIHSVTPTEITVYTNEPFIYAVNITRVW